MKRTVIKSGEKIEMEYDAVCHELGIRPDVRFVEITTRGTIMYTAGKREEIRFLLKAAEKAGFKPSQKLIQAANS